MFEGATAPGAGDDLTYTTMKLGQYLRARGHQVNTLDMAEGPFDAVIFSDHPTIFNSYFRKLRKTKTKLYLFLMENGVNRPDNYWHRNHRDFEKVFTWNPNMADNKKFIRFFHTVKIPENFKVDVAQKNKFCVLVSSQKYSAHKKALYRERVDIIRWFEREHPDMFDLYGQRWDRYYFSNRLSRLNILLARFYRKFPRHFETKHFPSFLGPVPRKHEVMKLYRFAIVYENAALPGYLTEKIFDAFFAGCVPVYLGATNVLENIPAEAFVDRRNFASNEELYRYLNGMSEQEYLGKIKAIEKFVNGEGIKPFSAESFIDTFVRHIVTT
jgi:hypothetical protein